MKNMKNIGSHNLNIKCQSHQMNDINSNEKNHSTV